MKIAIILSGCGFLDGSEVNEVVLTILSLEKRKIDYQCFAPNIQQKDVINHINQKKNEEIRNVLIESARIVRSKILPLDQCNSNEFDGLIVPGGYGVVKNLSNYYFDKSNFFIEKNVLKICRKFIGKPVGYICIAPVLLPMIYKKKIKLTIGNDKKISNDLVKLGCKVVKCQSNDIVIDLKNNIITTPAYMLSNNIYDIYLNIDKLVCIMLDLHKKINI
ncbi:MAG: isoprenoid biosynthesis glyoxalase ElbB [Arsenophonus sp.]|nr:MAG: isoprenoid biosynthesis glyoxalase ElbB [Arsenophonus sp.]